MKNLSKELGDALIKVKRDIGSQKESQKNRVYNSKIKISYNPKNFNYKMRKR